MKEGLIYRRFGLMAEIVIAIAAAACVSMALPINFWHILCFLGGNFILALIILFTLFLQRERVLVIVLFIVGGIIFILAVTKSSYYTAVISGYLLSFYFAAKLDILKDISK